MKNESGQALLIVILTMIVALTVGLSVASRSITNVRISSSEEESQRAFSAAEAGVEEALKSGVSVGSPAAPTPLPNDSQYYATVTSASTNEYLAPGIAAKDDAVQIWLSTYPNYSAPYYSGSIIIGWGDSSDTCGPPINAPAMEIIIFYGNVNNPSVARFAVDACSGRGNNFSVASPGPIISGKTFQYGYTVSVSNGLIMRIIPLYKSTALGVQGSVAIPSQGKVVESTGSVGSVVRKIKVVQSYPSLPSLFDHAVFSGTSL